MIDTDNFYTKNLYEIIDDYFDSPILEKIQDNQNISVYMCKISTLLASLEQRYLIAITNKDNNSIGRRLSLSNINWKSFQTRTLVPNSSNYKIISHSYSPKNNDRFNSIFVNLLKRYEDHTEYFFEDKNYNKFIVSLLHKNKNLYEYPESGNLPACLETFKTIILINI
jgi:hypothetical protein